MTALSSPTIPPLQRRAAASAPRRRPPGAQRADGLTKGQRRGAVALIVAAHVAGVWGLLQVGEVREAAREALPMFVDLIAPPAPAHPTPPAPTPPVPTVLKPRPVPPRPTPAPKAPTLIAAAPSPAPASFDTPPAPPSAPAAEPAPVSAVVAPPAPAAAPAPVAAAKTIPPSAVQYLVEPAPEYPRASTRNRETGRVLVLLYIDAAGLPSQVQVARSSGHSRLDEAAVAAVAKSRFRPPTVNGEPVSGWANVPIDFELETKK